MKSLRSDVDCHRFVVEAAFQSRLVVAQVSSKVPPLLLPTSSESPVSRRYWARIMFRFVV